MTRTRFFEFLGRHQAQENAVVELRMHSQRRGLWIVLRPNGNVVSFNDPIVQSVVYSPAEGWGSPARMTRANALRDRYERWLTLWRTSERTETA